LLDHECADLRGNLLDLNRGTLVHSHYAIDMHSDPFVRDEQVMTDGILRCIEHH
jgi:hypothetical protein